LPNNKQNKKIPRPKQVFQTIIISEITYNLLPHNSKDNNIMRNMTLRQEMELIIMHMVKESVAA
jgi:hypothetical protein